ncbi:hypothetical protein ACJX0J_019740 [Zea mays]
MAYFIGSQLWGVAFMSPKNTLKLCGNDMFSFIISSEHHTKCFSIALNYLFFPGPVVFYSLFFRDRKATVATTPVLPHRENLFMLAMCHYLDLALELASLLGSLIVR